MRAQEPATPPYELGEVVVSAGQPVSESSGTLRVVSAEDIRAHDARTLDGAIELLPGLDVRTGSDGVPRINVRGFRPRHVLLLLDGVPLNSTYDGQFDPTLIPVEQIAYIKLTPAPSSVLYGDNGIAGTINIVTRKGSGGFHGEVAAEARDHDTALLRASAGGGSGRITAFGSASGFRTDGYSAPLQSPSIARTGGETLRSNTDRKRVSVFGSLTAAATDRLSIGLVLSGVHSEYGIPTTAVDDPDDPFARQPTYERVPEAEQRSAQLAVSYSATGPFALRSWLYTNRYHEDHVQYDDSSYASLNDSTMRGSYSQSSHSRSSGLGVQASVNGKDWGRVTLALGAERDDWRSDQHIRDVPVTPSGGGGGGGGSGGGGGGGGGGGSGGGTVYQFRNVADSRRMDRGGVALEYQLHPVTAAGIVLGYTHDWLDKDSAGGADAGSWSAGAYYDVARSTRLRAAAARKMRFPTISQLYDPGRGNPALHEERADEFEVGIEQALPARSRLSITAFRTDAHGFIERPSQGEPLTNFQAYRFDGIELLGETKAIEHLSLRAGYSFMDTEDRSSGSAREALQYRPRHKLTLESRYAFTSGTDVGFSLMRVAGQVLYSRTGPVQQAELPDYTLAALRVRQRIPGTSASLHAGAENLFDEHYEDEYGYPQPSRQLYIGATIGW